MGEGRPAGTDDDRPACCGHARKLHTPTCEYYLPGTRLDPPRICGCDGTPRNGSLREGPLSDPSDRPDVSG